MHFPWTVTRGQCLIAVHHKKTLLSSRGSWLRIQITAGDSGAFLVFVAAGYSPECSFEIRGGGGPKSTTESVSLECSFEIRSSPSSSATRFRFLKEFLPVSSSSNRLKALMISSVGASCCSWGCRFAPLRGSGLNSIGGECTSGALPGSSVRNSIGGDCRSAESNSAASNAFTCYVVPAC